MSSEITLKNFSLFPLYFYVIYSEHAFIAFYNDKKYQRTYIKYIRADAYKVITERKKLKGFKGTNAHKHFPAFKAILNPFSGK